MLASYLGLTERWIQQLAADSEIPVGTKASAGRWKVTRRSCSGWRAT
ncbi:MAG: hypothetical protein Q8L91_14530 [Polaromonas sp.]|nr:hypothetical protein [Polaromonas sp.]